MFGVLLSGNRKGLRRRGYASGVSALGLSALLMAGAASVEAQARCDSVRVAALPVIERPATSDTNATLVVLLTGDGGWAGADEKVAIGLRARGAAVVGLNMRSYLGDKKTPDQVASDVGCIAQVFGDRWKRPRLMLLGYSRGADIVPFVAARWPAALRERLNMVAMVSLSQSANFKFHLIDLVRDVKRDDDVLVAPEIAKLKGLRVVCVYGEDESDSGCRGADPQVLTAYARPGGHRLTEGFEGVADILSAGLRPARP
ncbi:MAG: AcvB/VirJ family lysyl-phosphatidylglycerol hydrolase [Gemmatimonadaceae bacterium]